MRSFIEYFNKELKLKSLSVRKYIQGTAGYWEFLNSLMGHDYKVKHLLSQRGKVV